MQIEQLKKVLIVCCYPLILAGLYVIRLHSYLLYHCSVEIFSVCVAFAIFMIVWNSQRFIQNYYLLFIGIAYLFIGTLDMIHMLAYTGMGVFQGYGTNLPTQIWISARYMESLSLLIAPFFLKRHLNINLSIFIYGSVFTLLISSIFFWGFFPVCFDEQTGLTIFKEVSEFLIIGILFVSLILLLRQRNKFDPKVLNLVSWSIGLTMVSELMFTMYAGPYEAANMSGHLIKLISFYLMYKALIEIGLRHPYNLLFRDLKQSELELQKAHDELEIKVQKRTAELVQSEEKILADQEQLRALTEELLAAQERERRKIATGLHDSIGQILAFLKIELGDLLRSELSKETANTLRHLREQVEQAIKQTRTLTFEMSPPELYTLGLKYAIEELAHQFSEERGLTCTVDTSDSYYPLSEQMKILLYRSVRELLVNAAKHAQADSVQIRVQRVDNDIEITVEDNGTGFDASGLNGTQYSRSPGLGLLSIRERLKQMGGRLDIRSSRGQGTKVILVAPLEKNVP
jgi:signal transduction histidine kinase